MPAEDALRALVAALNANPTINVIVAASEDTGDRIQRLNLHDDLAAEFLLAAKDTVPALNGELVLRPYEAGYKPEAHELSYIDLENDETIRDRIRDISQVQHAELFAEDEAVIDALRFYAIVVGAGTRRRAAFFRVYSPKKELSRHAGFAALLQRGSYDKVKRKIFLFDHRVDCFSWDQYLFIQNVNNFQRIFEYFEQLRAQAAATVAAVAARIPIRNVDDFSAACTSQVYMMSKLATIAKRPYLQRVTIEDIKRTIEAFDLAVEVVNEDGREMLVFEKALAKRWLILKLLDDDYLGSVMTAEKYEVNSKSRI